MTQRTISKKKAELLYKLVSDAITDARIEIHKLDMLGTVGKKHVDDILYKLNCNAPQIAIDHFKKKP